MKKLIVLISALILITSLMSVSVIQKYYHREIIMEELPQDNQEEVMVSTIDKFHFINVGWGDCILLESNGKYALIDGGEDSDNPLGREELNYAGNEAKVLDELHEIIGDKIKLEFIVATHAHSDHIGVLDTIISDPDVEVNKIYMKEYKPQFIDRHERKTWDNHLVYQQLIESIEKKGNLAVLAPMEDQLLTLGDFTIRFYNVKDNLSIASENERSLGLLVTKDQFKAFLAGDITNIDGDEDRLGQLIGQVDLLKYGHHGSNTSSSIEWLKVLKPKVGIVSGMGLGVNMRIRTMSIYDDTKVYATYENDGVYVDVSQQDMVVTSRKGEPLLHESDGLWMESDGTLHGHSEWNNPKNLHGFYDVIYQDDLYKIYIKEDGYLARNETIEVNNQTYTFNEYGIMELPVIYK